MQHHHGILLVDVESSHNAILGRLWLHMMKVVSSTYHQLVRYPTPSETVDIREDHAMSRIISAIARKKSGWRSKTAKAVSDEDLPAGKKQK